MHLEVKVEGKTDRYLVKAVLRHLKAELGTHFEHNITLLKETQKCQTGDNFADFPYVRKLRLSYEDFVEDIEKQGVFIAILDLDDRDLERHRQDFAQTFPSCKDFALIIAIKDVEAWLMGDMPAIKCAIPHHLPLVDGYREEIHGDKDEFLRIIRRRNSTSEKRFLAFKSVVPHMRFDSNTSPSFQVFLTKLRELLTA